MSATTQIARKRAKCQFQWFIEIAEYLTDDFEIPRLSLPGIKPPEDFRLLEEDEIDEIALKARKHFGFGEAPAGHVVRALERHGIVVGRLPLVGEKLDAFCEFSSRPVIILSSNKSSAVRSRFDACHELGHILLHRKVSQTDLNTSSKFKLIEQQANRFAGAFLLPHNGFSKDVWTPSLACFRELKEKWGAAIAAMARRCLQLGMLNDKQFTAISIEISRKGWRKREPLDDFTKPERPRLLEQCLEMLIATKSKTTIVSEINLPARIVEDLLSLPLDYFSEEESDLKVIQIRSSPSASPPISNGGASIISFNPASCD